MAELSRRFPSLQFDPQTGVSKLDTDILFDSGEAELKPAAGELIDELVRVLNSPAAGDLKLMVAGHTDNQVIVAGETRERYRRQLPPQHGPRPGGGRADEAGRPARAAAGRRRFRPYQPIASNSTAPDRQKNRRVEIFVMPSDVPVVGWSDSTPSVYGNGPRR